MIPAALAPHFARAPALFSVPAGIPFIPALMDPVLAAYAAAPEALPDLSILLPNRRAVRAATLYVQNRSRDTAAHYLPRLQALGDLDEDDLQGLGRLAMDDTELPPAVDGLSRALLLAAEIAETAPYPLCAGGLAARLRAADALGRLLDSFALAGLSLEALDRLSPLMAQLELAGHWQASLDFLDLLRRQWPQRLAERGGMDAVARRVAVLQRLTASVRDNNIRTPIIIAGALGTNAVIGGLMAAVANAPMGLVILPGADYSMPVTQWKRVDPPHPQALIRNRLQRDFGLSDPGLIEPWCNGASAQYRRDLLNLALLPAEATEDWNAEFRAWQERDPGAQGLVGLKTAIAQNEEEEADFICLHLLDTLSVPGKTAMLVTPDRQIARRVVARLALWGVDCDDSAGRPALETYRGAFLLLIAEFLARPSDAVRLLAMLGHEFSALGHPGPEYAAGVAALRTALRRAPIVGDWPEVANWLRQQSGVRSAPLAVAILDWLDAAIAAFHAAETLRAQIEALIEMAEALATSGTEEGATRLWRLADGEALAMALEACLANPLLDIPAPAGAFDDHLRAILGGATVRIPSGHARLSILGLVEARLQTADCVVLAGLNEGIWPQKTADDPFLSMGMRRAIDLPDTEEAVGRAAHDFVQLATLPEVLLIRSMRTARVPTSPCRWWLRLQSVLDAAELSGMADLSALLRARLVARFSAPAVRPAPMPAPNPPLSARPRRFSVSSLNQLSRDPYGFYAEEILRLRSLRPVGGKFDDRDRGLLLHRVMEFLPFGRLPPDLRAEILRIVRAELARNAHDPTLELELAARLDTLAGVAARLDQAVREGNTRAFVEESGTATFGDVAEPIEIHGRVDRMDLYPDGKVSIIDFKSGQPGSMKLDDKLDLQLSALALMTEAGGFAGPGARKVCWLGYWSLSDPDYAGMLDPKAKGSIGPDAMEEHLQNFRIQLSQLLGQYLAPDMTFRSQVRPANGGFEPPFDHLARRREWSFLDAGDE